jgi:hypothetical protein
LMRFLKQADPAFRGTESPNRVGVRPLSSANSTIQRPAIRVPLF